MDESVTCTDEGKRSILKPRIRVPLQEVQSFFPDDDATVTCTLTKNRRVSFGRNLVKGFIVGSAADCEAVYEYEQSSESLSEPSECSGPLDLAVNRSVPMPPPAVAHDASISRPPEERARIFTENCISIAKSVFQDTETELTAIIIGAKPTSIDSSCMSFTNLDMSSRFENVCDPKMSQTEFVTVSHADLAQGMEPPEKSRYDFLNGSFGHAALRNRPPLGYLQAVPWEQENDENIPPAHCSFRQQPTPTKVMCQDNTMEFTCANAKQKYALNAATINKPDYNSDMEETCAKALAMPSQNSTLWDDISDTDDNDDPLRLDGTRDNFLSDLSGIDNNSYSDCSLDGIQKELANLSTANRTYRQQLQNLNATQSQTGLEVELPGADGDVDVGSPLARMLSPSFSHQVNLNVKDLAHESVMELTQSQDDEQDPFVNKEISDNIFSSPEKSLYEKSNNNATESSLKEVTQSSVVEELGLSDSARLSESVGDENSGISEENQEKLLANNLEEDMEFTHCKRLLPAMADDGQGSCLSKLSDNIVGTDGQSGGVTGVEVNEAPADIAEEDMEFTHCVRLANLNNVSVLEDTEEMAPVNLTNAAKLNAGSDLNNSTTNSEQDPFENIAGPDALFSPDVTSQEDENVKNHEIMLLVNCVEEDPSPVLPAKESPHQHHPSNDDDNKVEDEEGGADEKFSNGVCFFEQDNVQELTGVKDIANPLIEPIMRNETHVEDTVAVPVQFQPEGQAIMPADTTSICAKRQTQAPSDCSKCLESAECVPISVWPEHNAVNDDERTTCEKDETLPPPPESDRTLFANENDVLELSFAPAPVVSYPQDNDDGIEITMAAQFVGKSGGNETQAIDISQRPNKPVNVTLEAADEPRLPLNTPLVGLAALAKRPSLREKLEKMSSDSTVVSVTAELTTPADDAMRSMELSQSTASRLVKTMSDEQHMHAICESTRIIHSREYMPSDRTYQLGARPDSQTTFSVPKQLSEDTYCVNDQVAAVDSSFKRLHSDSPSPGERFKKTRPSCSPGIASISRSSLGTRDPSFNEHKNDHNDLEDIGPGLEAAKKRLMESPLPLQPLCKKKRPSPVNPKVAVDDADLSYSGHFSGCENLDVSISLLENMTLGEDDSVCMRGDATMGTVHVTPLRPKSFQPEKSYLCPPGANFAEDLNECSITQPVANVPPVDDFTSSISGECGIHHPNPAEAEHIPINEPMPLPFCVTSQIRNDYQRIVGVLQIRAQEEGCVWDLETLRSSSEEAAGLIAVHFPLIATGLVLEIRFQGDKPRITQISTLHRQSSQFLWPYARQINDFGFNALALHIKNMEKRLQHLDELPDFVDFFNAYAKKVKSLMQDVSQVLRGCPSIQLIGNKLAIRLMSYHFLIISWVDLDLTDMLILGSPKITFRHEMNRMEEKPIREILRKVKTPTLQNFIELAFGWIVERESDVGHIMRRPPLLFHS